MGLRGGGQILSEWGAAVKIVMMASHPSEIELTMALTMTVGDWLNLAEQCKDKYPGWQLTSAIANAVNNVKQKFEEQVERP